MLDVLIAVSKGVLQIVKQDGIPASQMFSTSW